MAQEHVTMGTSVLSSSTQHSKYCVPKGTKSRQKWVKLGITLQVTDPYLQITYSTALVPSWKVHPRFEKLHNFYETEYNTYSKKNMIDELGRTGQDTSAIRT